MSHQHETFDHFIFFPKMYPHILLINAFLTQCVIFLLALNLKVTLSNFEKFHLIL